MKKFFLVGMALAAACSSEPENKGPSARALPAADEGRKVEADDPIASEATKLKQAEYKTEYLENTKPWKRATCDFGEGDGKEPCDFRFSDEGDGSFEAREVGDWGLTYYFTLVAKDEMVVERYAAKLVPLGDFRRDQSDRACWIGEVDQQRICVW